MSDGTCVAGDILVEPRRFRVADCTEGIDFERGFL